MKVYLTNEIVRIMREYLNKGNSYKLTKPDMKAVSEGLSMSKTVCAQQKFVNVTPWMKNLLISCGDLKQTFNKKTNKWDTDKLDIEHAKSTKAGDLLSRIVKACLLKFNGKERTEYNEQLSPVDQDHYNVDCWIQNKFNDYWYDIAPGQAKQRAEALLEYERSTSKETPRLIKKLMSDKVFLKAVEYVVGRYPDIKANHVIEQISSPFMGKDSNVGYPYFRNDKREFGKGVTYGRYTIELATKITKNMSDPFAILPYNVYTVWARNQRGKGRALEAQSRLVNLVCNSLQAPEIEGLKKLPEYIGLLDDDSQKQAMIKMAEFLEANSDYTAGNWDQTGFDRHISEFLVLIAAAMRAVHASGDLAEKLNLLRFLQTQKGWCIDGANNKLTVIYGRTMSGDIDTMSQNTIINFLDDVYSNMLLDEKYSTKVLYQTNYHGFYLGDDVLSIHKRDPRAKDVYTQTSKALGLEVNKSKYAYGLFFLQYRLFKDKDGYHMVYAWTRVLRSMLSKEEKKGLGPVGWSLSGWQQLSKLTDFEPALYICLNIIYPLDKDGLFLDKDINWVKEQIKIEDQQAKEKNARARSTAEILYTGNPQQERQFSKSGAQIELDYDYLSELQLKLRKLVDKNFYASIGFKTPDISRVH